MKIIFFLTTWIGLMLLLSDKVIPDLSIEEEPYIQKGSGHPLLQDN